MTATLAPATAKATARDTDPSITAAEDYFTAKKVVDAFNKRSKPHRDIMAASLVTLSERHPNAVTPITVFGNTTEQFEHRVDDTVKWAEVAKGLLPTFTREQREHYNRLVAEWGSTRTTKRFK